MCMSHAHIDRDSKTDRQMLQWEVGVHRRSLFGVSVCAWIKSLCPVSREDDQPSVSDGEDLQGLEENHSESAFDFDALWVVSL